MPHRYPATAPDGCRPYVVLDLAWATATASSLPGCSYWTVEDFDTDSYAVVAESAMVAWASGWDDGAYPTRIGRDSSGEVTCFVTDMLLFPPAEAG